MPAQPSFRSLFFGFRVPTSVLIKTCHFYPENVVPRTRCLDGVNWKGERPSVAAPSPSPEMVSKLSVRASARDLLLGTPTTSQRERSIFTSLVGM